MDPEHAGRMEPPECVGCCLWSLTVVRADGDVRSGGTSSTRLLQLAGVERLPRAKNEIWYQGSETPRSGRRVTRVVSRAA